MTKPIQAQIGETKAETMVRIIFEHLSDIDGDEADWLLYREDLISAAQAIIAAEVGDRAIIAAEVGEQIAPCDDAEFGTYDHNANDMRNVTIERCAQVAEAYGTSAGLMIAGAIRELKEKPLTQPQIAAAKKLVVELRRWNNCAFDPDGPGLSIGEVYEIRDQLHQSAELLAALTAAAEVEEQERCLS